MRSFIFLFTILLFTACKKENLPTTTAVKVTPAHRGTNIAEVQSAFMRMLSNGAMATVLEPNFYGRNSSNFNPTVTCVDTEYTQGGNSLDINFDTLAGNTVPCLLPNGAKIDGDLAWNLNFNENVWTTRECQPGFLSFDRIYCDGAVIEEVRGPNVQSPKFFVNQGCPDADMLTEPTDPDLDLNFKVGGDFHYVVTSESGRVTLIDPIPSPGIFAMLTTANDFDDTPNFNDLYERSYALDVNVPNNISFCPFTKVQVFEPDNTSGTPDDFYSMMSTEPLIYTPFACKHVTAGMLELREVPASCDGNTTAADAALLMTIDFGVDANGTFNANQCDSYVYVCDYSIDPSSPTCEVKDLTD